MTIGVSNVTINGNDGDTVDGSSNCEDGNEGNIESDGTVCGCPGGKVVPIPIPLTVAETACSSCGNNCVLLLGFQD